MREWSSYAQVIYNRTFVRNTENWTRSIKRVIEGNIRQHNVEDWEVNALYDFMESRKAMPAGRGLWFSGAPAHDELGGAALCNCWFVTGDKWENLPFAMDLLMLGGGVGLSIEHKYVSKLPKVKTGVQIEHRKSKDTFFIVPDTREGWCELIRLVLESYFVTGKSFSYSTICIRGKGEAIRGFGGTASGPMPLIKCVDTICNILDPRAGKHIRPIDMMDLLCCIGEMVKAGNVRRSAIIILGDPWDREYLTAKRWDLKQIPSYRGSANLSVINSDFESFHPSFWRTYEAGEPYGVVNLETIKKFGRMGELKPDTAIGVNPCAEATLECYEPCNLQEIFLPHLKNKEEFFLACRLMHRWGKRVCMEKYHRPEIESVIRRNMRIGTGITGCLQSDLFTPEILDEAYAVIQKENKDSAKEYGVNESIRTTLIKPSGTLSGMGDVFHGIHPSLAEYVIRRVRFADDSPMIPVIRDAGYKIEPEKKLDGSVDFGTLVVDFPLHMGGPTSEEIDTWRQLDIVKMAQKHWADQSISVTVYYDRSEIPKVKQWFKENLSEIKTMSFLCKHDHGFEQAPIEPITKEQYERSMEKLKPLGGLCPDSSDLIEDCEGGSCPTR